MLTAQENFAIGGYFKLFFKIDLDSAIKPTCLVKRASKVDLRGSRYQCIFLDETKIKSLFSS